MLNRYPLWKNIMLVLVLIIGLLYALPNIYGKDPAVQIIGVRGLTASTSTLIQTRSILKQQNIASKSIVLEHGVVIARFVNSDMQLRAREALMTAFGNKYIVALNLAPATPTWLGILGAMPIRLGLDLRGGIYFLIEVDIDAVLDKLQEQMIDAMRDDLQDNGISYTRVRKIGNYGTEIYFSNIEARDRAISWLKPHYHNLVINSQGDTLLRAVPMNDYLHQVQEFAVQRNITILRNRVNQLGVAEALVQRQGVARIVVELPDIQDTARAKEILEATAGLEFRLVNSAINQITTNNVRVPIDSEIKVTRSGKPVILYKRVILTGDHITDSTYSSDEYNHPQVNIFLDSIGGMTMSSFTKNNIGKMLAILLVEYKNSGKKDVNGRSIMVKQEEVLNIATIQSRLGNSFRITGINNSDEARQLSLLLRAGALIAPIQIVEEQTIGPTLGSQNIAQGLEACLWGLIVLVIFMAIWYRIFGLIVTAMLITNLVMIIGIMSMLPGATLTMPGIAGIALTLAMAVDANVLINERIKEELRNGLMVQQAIHNGYSGAFSSIIDANVTTLITASILYVMGTGPIKGFATTTIIGISVSMFTAIVGTRAIVNLIYGGKHINNLPI